MNKTIRHIILAVCLGLVFTGLSFFVTSYKETVACDGPELSVSSRLNRGFPAKFYTDPVPQGCFRTTNHVELDANLKPVIDGSRATIALPELIMDFLIWVLTASIAIQLVSLVRKKK